jgi:hypothetical protein
MKARNECLFCAGRKCTIRIVRVLGMAPKSNDTAYDEIACSRHTRDLEKHADETLGRGNGVARLHISGGRYRRGEQIPADVFAG